MTNKFIVKSCCYCKDPVPVGAGRVWKYGTRWYGCHVPCGVIARAKRAATVADVVPTPAEVS